MELCSWLSDVLTVGCESFVCDLTISSTEKLPCCSVGQFFEIGPLCVLRFLVEEARQRLHPRFRFKRHLWGLEGGSIQGRKWARNRWRGQKREEGGNKRGVKNVKSRTQRRKEARKTRFRGGC